ncbi:HEAT repeat domain-containing protein [Archangium lansingense]|uniref:HEAT repeat domain-containing protein n=1 Tax=Archangium lansingense TaxID=2995310 RepID=A0ABT4A8S9_9BACT|nr:HEAT repeat domain-containing protein [Archangium lansinium]MCY1077659.1 HEAT repeat domain-containing protein [Archangium lansinium]
MKPGLLIALVALMLGACRSREPSFPVEHVSLKGATVVDNGLLGWAPSSVHELFTRTLRDSRRFEFLEEGGKGKGEKDKRALEAWSFTLELPFTREALKDGSSFSFAEVGVTLAMERPGVEHDQRYQVVGLGEVRVEGKTPEARREALREALRRAFTQVTHAAALQLAAVERPDAALVQDLQSQDERVREFALRVLADRRNPAAAPLLIRQLEEDDPQVVRQAIGALAEMKAPGAVPALIDLVKDREVGFVQEVVFAIGEIGGTEAEAYLFTVAQGHDQPDVQAAAKQALDTLLASRKLAAPEARGTDRAEH